MEKEKRYYFQTCCWTLLVEFRLCQPIIVQQFQCRL